MALNWKHEENEQFTEWEALDPFEREMSIFRTMSVGMNKVTEKNVDTWFIRNHIIYKALGGLQMTRKIAEACIGLSTNASEYTDAKFKSHIMKIMLESATHAYEWEKRDNDNR